MMIAVVIFFCFNRNHVKAIHFAKHGKRHMLQTIVKLTRKLHDICLHFYFVLWHQVIIVRWVMHAHNDCVDSFAVDDTACIVCSNRFSCIDCAISFHCICLHIDCVLHVYLPLILLTLLRTDHVQMHWIKYDIYVIEEWEFSSDEKFTWKRNAYALKEDIYV